MKFIRKALWPTAIVAAALMLFGALGSAINADTLGDVQSSTGDNVVEAGEEVAIYVVVSADTTTESAQEAAVRDAVDAVVAATEVGDVNRADLELRKALIAAEIGLAMTQDNPPVLADPLDLDNPTGVLVTALNTAVDTFNGEDGATLANERAVTNAAKAITALLPGTPDTLDDTEYTVEVDGDAEITKVLTSATVLKAQRSGRTSADVKHVTISADDAKSDLLKGFDLTAKTSVLLVVVECTSGAFDISFDSDSAAGIGETASFDCQGSVAGAEISASKSTLGTSGSSAESVITVTIEDEDGTAATPGDDVEFTTNACVFGNDKNAQTVESEADGDDTIAEATLDCSGVSAGAVTVTARIDKPGRDVLMATTVTVFGPPAELTVLGGPMMRNLTCGEVVTLTIIAVDSAGQPVANGTVVNLTTNIAGVLVAPAFTSGGVAKAYLITSNSHVGSYAVVVHSGPAVGYITVSCEAAAAAGVLIAPAPVEAPAITPPSTGNAGLAETSGSSWMLLAIAGALASVMVAVGKGMPSFFRR